MDYLRYYILLIIFIGSLTPLFNCTNVEIPKHSDEDWSFIVFGDIRRGYGVYSKIVTNITDISPIADLAICLGDMMHTGGNEAEWLNFWRYSKPITKQMPFYLARGNHEGNTPELERIFREQTRITRETFYYNFDHRGQCFFILDTEIRDEEGGILNDQFQWLSTNLDSVSQEPGIENIFINMHRPLFPQGRYKGYNLRNANNLHALFKKYPKVRAVFASHEHSFSFYEYEGVKYIITGGAGAPLYKGYGGDFHHFCKVSFYENEKKITLKTIGLFNEVVVKIDL